MTDRDTPHHDLAAYLLGALTPSERARFEQHLEACATCRAELLELRRPARLLARAGAPHALPDGLEARTFAAIEREASARVPVLVPAPRRRRLPRVAALAAVAAAVAVAFAAGTQLDRQAGTVELEGDARRGRRRDRSDRRGAEDRDRPRDPLRHRRAADPARGRVLRALVRRPGRHAREAEPHLRGHVPPGRERALARALRSGGRPGQVSRS